jgi:hypothetical protein
VYEIGLVKGVSERPSSSLAPNLRSRSTYQADVDRHNHLSYSHNRRPSFLLFLSSRLCRPRRLEPSSSSLRPEPRSRSAYQVDEDRVNHLSCREDKNSTSYSSYLQDCVDREGWNRPPCWWYRSSALVATTKSTGTGSTTSPILTIGTLLLTLPIFKIVSTEKVGAVLLVVATEAALS